jgi:hypothetical protein
MCNLCYVYLCVVKCEIIHSIWYET